MTTETTPKPRAKRGTGDKAQRARKMKALEAMDELVELYAQESEASVRVAIRTLAAQNLVPWAAIARHAAALDNDRVVLTLRFFDSIDAQKP